MAERLVDLTAHLKAGLLKDSRTPRNVEGMSALTNVKGESGTLVYAEPLHNPVSTRTTTWPFPQLFRTTQGLAILTATSFNLLTEGTFATVTPITTYDFANKSTVKAIPAGGAWHFYEANQFAVATNGSCVLMTWVDTTDGTAKTFVFDDYIAEATCIHRGRVLFANMSGGTPPWFSHFSTLATAGGANVNLAAEEETRKVWWSSVGGGDETFLFQDPANIPGFETYLLRNDSGYMHMPWTYPVLALRPLAEKVIVYGNNGIGALILSPELNTYGYQHILDVGIHDRGAQTGDDSIHHFVDGQGYLWSISSDLEVKRLGYQNLFLAATETIGETTFGPSSIMLIWNSHKQELYMSFGNANWTQADQTYLLAEGIMSQLEQVVISGVQSFLSTTGEPDKDIFVVSGTPFTTEVITDDTEQTFTAITHITDFGTRDEKAIEWIEVTGEGITDLEGAASFRHDSRGVFASTPWVKANADGSIPVAAGGVDFKILLRGTVLGRGGTAVRLEGLSVVVKRIDVRDVRGMR